jgi:hypothetical protein
MATDSQEAQRVVVYKRLSHSLCQGVCHRILLDRLPDDRCVSLLLPQAIRTTTGCRWVSAMRSIPRDPSVSAIG